MLQHDSFSPLPTSQVRVGPRRVLLAEDDARFRDVIAERLADEGYEVVGVGDGRTLLAVVESALASPSAASFDAIVCDHRMPRMSGLAALRSLRSVDWWVPFVLITAFADDAVRRTAQVWGASAVLGKPFELDELLEILDRVV